MSASALVNWVGVLTWITVSAVAATGSFSGAALVVGTSQSSVSRSVAAVESILDNACHGGKVALLGIFPDQFAVDWDKVIFNGLTIKGIYGREMYETWYKMTSMIQTGLDITFMITHKFHYTEFEQAFEVMRSGNSGKVIMDWVDD